VTKIESNEVDDLIELISTEIDSYTEEEAEFWVELLYFPLNLFSVYQINPIFHHELKQQFLCFTNKFSLKIYRYNQVLGFLLRVINEYQLYISMEEEFQLYKRWQNLSKSNKFSIEFYDSKKKTKM